MTKLQLRSVGNVDTQEQHEAERRPDDLVNIIFYNKKKARFITDSHKNIIVFKTIQNLIEKRLFFMRQHPVTHLYEYYKTYRRMWQ